MRSSYRDPFSADVSFAHSTRSTTPRSSLSSLRSPIGGGSVGPANAGRRLAENLYRNAMGDAPPAAAPARPAIAGSRVGPAARPRMLVCYLCGQQYGTASLPIHQVQCYTKSLIRWERGDPATRGNRPIHPDERAAAAAAAAARGEEDMRPFGGGGGGGGMSSAAIDRFNQQQFDDFTTKTLVPCENCGRTFLPDRLVVHLRSCKPGSGSRPVARSGGANNTSLSSGVNSSVHASSSVSPTAARPKAAAPPSTQQPRISPVARETGAAPAAAGPRTFSTLEERREALRMRNSTADLALDRTVGGRVTDDDNVTPALDALDAELQTFDETLVGRSGSRRSGASSRRSTPPPGGPARDDGVDTPDHLDGLSSPLPPPPPPRRDDAKSPSPAGGAAGYAASRPPGVVRAASPAAGAPGGPAGGALKPWQKRPTVSPGAGEPTAASSPRPAPAPRVTLAERMTANLVPCRHCQRTFAPDRVERHEGACIHRNNPVPPPAGVAAAGSGSASPSGIRGGSGVSAATASVSRPGTASMGRQSPATSPSTAAAAGGAPRKFCDQCGTKVLVSTARFCSECGNPLGR